jgi:hypothetical protein
MAKSSKSHPPFYRRSFLVVPYSKKTALKEARHYNEQPRWQLHSMVPKPTSETLRLLREFGSVAHEASEEFRWATTYPEKSDKWSIRENFEPWDVLQHGWTHVSFKDLDCNAQNVRRGDGKAALRQTVFALKTGELEALIEKASQRKPVEVAHLWYRCKSKENIYRVLQEFYRWAAPSVGIKKLLNKIPSPAELAAQYIQLIYENPGKESDDVRNDLSLLVAPGAIKAAGKNGKPGVIYSWADVVYIRAMAYCFVKQISQARSFLKVAEYKGRDARANISLDFLGGKQYAEILKEVGPGDPKTGQGDNRVAGILAGKLLDISDSYVNRVFYSKAPRF